MKKNLNDLKKIYEEQRTLLHMREVKKGYTFKVVMGKTGIENNAKEILYKVNEKNNELLTDVLILQDAEYKSDYKLPIVEVINKKNSRYIYDDITVEKALTIFEKHAVGHKVVTSLLKEEIKPAKE